MALRLFEGLARKGTKGMISIVIPVYNGERHLPTMLACLRAQEDASAFEAIFVNDGSSDNSLSLLQRAEGTERFAIRVLSMSNSGVSAARNAGLNAARGAYVCFADVDDLLAPNYISTLQKCAEACPADVLRFGFTRVDAGAGSMPAAVWTGPAAQDVQRMLRDFLADPKLFGPYGFLYRRDFLAVHQLRYAEGRAYYEDYDFLVRAVALAKHLHATDAVLYAYRQADGSAMMRFSVQRVHCLDLADALVAFLRSERLPVADEFEKWYKPRLYWAVFWQVCMALPRVRDARRFLECTGGRKLLAALAHYPSAKVAKTALLGRFSPEIYALLARILGRRHSLLHRMTADEADALFATMGQSRIGIPA